VIVLLQQGETQTSWAFGLLRAALNIILILETNLNQIVS